jgi:hypothetical protein
MHLSCTGASSHGEQAALLRSNASQSSFSQPQPKQPKQADAKDRSGLRQRLSTPTTACISIPPLIATTLSDSQQCDRYRDCGGYGVVIDGLAPIPAAIAAETGVGRWV